jgi:hypothetical protein
VNQTRAIAPLLLVLTLASGRSGAAQGYRLRLDTRAQAVSYRGVLEDSVPVGDTVTGPTGGPVTPQGFAATCFPGSAHCLFFRPGPEQRAQPLSSTADLTAWGLGLPGLSLRATARLATTVGSSDQWPGTDPPAQLLEGYAQYARRVLTIGVGRQTTISRLGYTGFDGGQVTLRSARHGFELAGYGGWGLWRGSALPVTSSALNPLGEFRPPERTLVAGGSAGWITSRFDAKVVYQREVDPSVDYFVSERAGIDAAIRPVRGVSLAGGADYDLAEGWWGSAEATLGYAMPNGRLNARVGVRRYRPHFDLWTIWGAFAPVPYTAVNGSLEVTPIRGLQLRTSGERYTFADAAAATPLVSVENSGWRFSWGATYTLARRWTVQGGYRAEFGPGAASRGFDGGVSYRTGDRLTLGLQAAMLDRPLEFRFDSSSVHLYGIYAHYQPTSRVRFELDASQYLEDRQRPDAAAFSWNQTRVSARVVLTFASGADLLGLPPAVQRMPTGAGR